MENVKSRRLLKIDEAAEQLAISRSQIYRLIDDGSIKTVRIGTRGQRIPDSEIDRLIESRLGAGDDRLDFGAIEN